nr:MAG TPA: hypothetical protein [Caudoviricetes sp.]
MSDVAVHHIGGGGGSLSKCSIIVHIDTGSSVGAYSDAAGSTKIAPAKEISTSGDYVISGLDIGTYYVKAEKNSDSTISSAITFSAYGIKELTLSYAVPMFGLEHQSWAEIFANMQQISLDGVYRQFNNTDPSLQLFSKAENQISYGIIWRTAIPIGKKYLKIRYTKTGNDNTIGLSSSVSAISSLVSAAVPASENEAIVSLPIQGVSDPSYIYVQGPSGGSDLRIIEVFVS